MSESHFARTSQVAADLPPVYSELLSSARRMLQRAESHAWAALLNEEMEFFRTYERVAIHERTPRPGEAAEHRREAYEEVHSEVRRHVRRSRELLVARQAELEREMQMQRVCGTHGSSAFAMESLPLPV